ncbi:MAG: glycoside hydrolase [Verrucomicrobiaceae bacterium]|nr:glycoside hydrolase [Verrucomicrobiaceae bacterium]
MKVVLCWHMHQPEYRDLQTGISAFPWTYLHAIKDYVDMVAHIEAHPQACAVVNFAPVLLDQIENYCTLIDAYLNRVEPFDETKLLDDSILNTLVQTEFSQNAAERLALLTQLLRVNRRRVVDRFPAYAQLAKMVDWLIENPASAAYCSDQFLIDVSVWYHLGWIAETVRRSDPRIEVLQEKGGSFSPDDRRLLLSIVQELMASIVPRYRALAEQGRVELAMSPYAHPIVPLLLDLNVAREAMPDAPLPESESYPDGAARTRWHLQQGLDTFSRHFGTRPQGCWPSEGAISAQTLQVLSEYDFRWVASGETVLRNSLALSEKENGFKSPGDCLHHVYRAFDIDCFFRDDGISDKIGFAYADWHGDHAVANLIHDLETIEKNCPNPADAVVSIILDGENAWEYYPENGFYFLDALYEKLSTHVTLELTTFQRIVADAAVSRVALPRIVAGSWVYGTLSTWIGGSDKNRGWDLLCDAKRAFDEVVAQGKLSDQILEQATHQLAICEGSDWFWWFGDYNPAQAVSDFEQLFRGHLRNLYRLLGVAAPAVLTEEISRGSGDPSRGGVMLQGQHNADKGGA